MKNYAHPHTLVSTDWVEQHSADRDVAIVEVDVDTAAYHEGHIPGAHAWNWQTQLCDTVQRDIIGRLELERLLGASGITNATTIILYGDNNNWFAAWAFWQLKLYGHEHVKMMNGGRKKWLIEGRPLTRDVPAPAPAKYSITAYNNGPRAMLQQVRAALERRSAVLVDVRSMDEFTGRVLSPPGLPETCQRGGHIPGARNIPWAKVCNDDGTFKSADELESIYGAQGVSPDRSVIAYCRIGERSSHTWFVLKYLLGFDNVMNYDGSWTEWGNLVGAPVEKGV
jgi:thiosulfate/3-mercaptopyruvate sulfurtransferase